VIELIEVQKKIEAHSFSCLLAAVLMLGVLRSDFGEQSSADAHERLSKLVPAVPSTIAPKRVAPLVVDELGREVPIMVSGTITDASGRTLSGQTTEAFLVSVSHVPMLSVGLNCALGAKQLRPYLQVLNEQATCFVSAYPNAGLPNEFGQYDQGPEEMGEQIEEFMKEGLINIIGGCCGTTPEHIRIIASIAAKYKPRVVHSQLSMVDGRVG